MLGALTLSHYIGGHASPPAATAQPTKSIATQVPTSTPTMAPTQPPFTGSWSTLPSLLSPEADNVAIYVHLQQGDYIYMTSGYHGRNFSPSYDHNLYRYNVAATQWEVLTSTFPSMFNNTVVQDEQKNLFFTAGYSPVDNSVNPLLYMYSTATGALQSIVPPGGISFGYGGSMIVDQIGYLYLTQWDTLAPLPQGVAYAVLASDLQGGIVLMGGVTDTNQNYGTRAIYRYHIAQDSWGKEQISAPIAFNGTSSCALGNGQIVVIGGYDSTQQITLASTWLVDLTTLNSSPLASLPVGGSRLGAAAYDGSGNIYLVRGVVNNPDQPTQDFWKLSLNG